MDSGKKTTEVSALVTLCHKYTQWDLPGGPGVKTLCFHCRGHRFSPGGGTKIYHMPHGMAKKKKKECVLQTWHHCGCGPWPSAEKLLACFAESLPPPPLSPASILCSSEGSHYAPSTLEEQGVKIHLLEGRGSMPVIWNSSAEICFFFSIYLYIQSFIYQYGLVDIYFILWVVIQHLIAYFIAGIVLALAIRSSFSWLLSF